MLSIKGWIILAGVAVVAFGGFQISNHLWKAAAVKEKKIFTEDQSKKTTDHKSSTDTQTKAEEVKDTSLETQADTLSKRKPDNAPSNRPTLSSDWLRELSRLR